jgi:hypothetical protein
MNWETKQRRASKQSQQPGFDDGRNRIREAYYTPKAFRSLAPGQANMLRPSRTGRWAVGAFIAFAGFGAGYYFATQPVLMSRIDEVVDARSNRSFNIPATGVIAMSQVPEGAVVAPLKLNGAADTDCLFELSLWEGGRASLLRVFVRSRETFETRIPLGKYTGTITCGSSWYGRAEFGLDASLDKIAAPLEFARAPNGQLQGMVIDLTRRVGGNLPAVRF